MATLLDEAMNASNSDVVKMPKYLPLATAQQMETVSSLKQKADLPSYKVGTAERLVRGANTALQSMADVAPALQLYGEEVQLGLGGYFGAKEDFIDRKKLNIETLQRNLAAAQQNRMQGTDEETANSWAFGIGQGLTNFALMYATGGVAAAGAKGLLGVAAQTATKIGAAAGIASAVPLENIEQQSDRIKFDEKGNIDTSNITPEWARKTAGGTTAYMVGMGILEAKVGMFKNLSQWQKPIPFKNKLLKDLSVPTATALKSFINEGTTEGLQSLLSSGIQLAEGNITMADMPDRIQQAWKEAIIGGILGGSVGTAVAINQAQNVKTMLNEEVSKVVTDPEECEQIVNAIYDSGTAEMTNIISKELELSSELNYKHGAIYDSMQGAIYDAINNAGAFQGIEEAEIAQYVSDTSKMFANQVLAEANKRGVLIDEVLKAGDIKFINGKIQLQAGKEVIAEVPIVQEEVSAEIVTQSTESDYSKRKKEVAYEILSEATGKSKKWLRSQLGSVSNNKGMSKRRENIMFLVRAAEDKISKNQAYHEWGEFYNINDVENGELNSSYELAAQALDDILNNNFKDPAQAANEYWNDYAESVKKEFEELINKIENVKTWEDADKLEKFIETISDDILFYDKNKLDNVYANMYKRISEGVNINETYSGNNAQNNETNEREISELNLRATQENSDTSAQRNNQDSKTGTNQEINNADLASAQEKLEQYGNKIPKNYRRDNKTKALWLYKNGYISKAERDALSLNKFYQLKNAPKQPKVYKGAYDVSEKAIELFKDADYSTLPHELAHFWLDNMWQFAKSGKASEAYTNNFQGVLDWLGVNPNQINLTRAQQEKFARGYEKYLLNGYAPNGLVQGAFDNYDKWLQKVYNDARELKVKLNADAIEFFDSMTTGELPEYEVPETQAEIRQKNIEQINKDVQETRKFVVEKQAEYNNYDGGNVITKETVPVTTEGEKRQSKAYTNQAAILGIAEELNYNKANIAEQNKKAADFVKNNLDDARLIVQGQKEAPNDILKNAIYNAYLKEMLAIGDNEAYISALRNQSLELTRAGQEIASQRGAIENIFDSGYWIRRIENLKKMRLAAQKFGGVTGAETEQALSKMNSFIKNKVEAVMPEFMEAAPEQQKTIAEKLSKEIAAEFKVKPDSTTLYQTMREPYELRTRTNAYNYIYRYINGALGLELSRAQANEIIAKTQAIQKSIETTRNRNGNPSALFFKNVSEMENYANSIEPSPALAILTSTVGRGNMLYSPKTILLNIESNIVNFLTEASTRRIANKSVNMAVDNKIIKDYLAYSREVFNTSGYQVSSMPNLDPTTQILSEKMTTTGGKGIVNSLGRFFEQTIFKYGLGAPDLFFKDMTFVDTANLLATKEAKGDSAKATELFKDICLIEPKTAKGKEIREIAINEALVATYQNKGKVSELALGIRNAINKSTGQLHLGDMLSPFVKTPANVIGLGFDYSMGGLLALRNIKTIYNDIQNGTFSDSTRQSIRSLARNGIGFAVAMMIANMLDDDDYIPEYALLDTKQRELVKMKGGVFNSVKIGDKYISLDYFGPLAMPLTSILNARKGYDAKSKIWNYFQGSAYQALKLPVIGDLKELLEGTGRTLTKDVDANIKTAQEALIDFVSSRAIPAIVTDIAKITDKFERETNNDAVKRLQSKIPKLREELPAQYNYGTGKPRETQNPITVLLAGARVKEEVTSPVIREIDKLSKKNTEDKVGLSKITKSGKLSALSSEQKIKVEKEFAQKYASSVNELIHTRKYNALDSNEKIKAINKTRDNIREEIKIEYGLAKPKKPKRRKRKRK